VLLGLSACALPDFRHDGSTGDGAPTRDAGPGADGTPSDGGPPPTDRQPGDSTPLADRPVSDLVGAPDSGGDIVVAADHPPAPDAPQVDAGPPGQITVAGVTTNGPVPTSPSITLDTPANARPGDFLWVALYVDMADSVVTTPDGWVRDKTVITNDNSTAWWFYRVLAAGDPQSTTFTFTTTVDCSGVMVAYRGAVAGPPEASQSKNGMDTDTSVILDALTTVTPDARVVVTVIADHAPVNSGPAGYMLQGDSTYAYIYDAIHAQPGTVDPIVFPCDGCHGYTLYAVALTPE
jgi:hypothetical protein